MPDFKLEIVDHPARQVVHGVSIPLLPDHRAIRINGTNVAYLLIDQPGRSLCFLQHFPEAFIALVRAEVEKQLGYQLGGSAAPPQERVVDDGADASDADEEDEDDDE